jgi:acetylornithine deacetylase/succinyl-diaminopimelate desuccinylase-like protein
VGDGEAGGPPHGGPAYEWDADGAGAEVRDEVVGLLGELIRADTSNPPGDVRPAADVLVRYFREHGVKPTVAGEDETTPNVTARLPGGDGPSLLLLGHLDVVPAGAGAWTHPPFSGAVADDFVWGRGALDMKNQLASQAVAFTRLARRVREGGVLSGDLVYAATADEETGVRCGAAWLFREHPELARAEYAVNEGGLDLFRRDGRRLYTVHTGEKGYANGRITVLGRAGHGSVPIRGGDSALEGAAAVITALQRYEPEVRTEFLPCAFIEQAVADPALRARLTEPATAHAAVRELAATDPAAAAVIEPMLGLTVVPTVVRAGEAINVIPGSAELLVDCRVLPGQTEEDVLRELERALEDVDARCEVEISDFMPGNSSTTDSRLHDAIVATIQESLSEVGGVVVVDALFSGFTDSTHVRGSFPGAVAYGFCPFVAETADRVRPRLHSVDERIAVEDLVFQTVFSERLALRLLT